MPVVPDVKYIRKISPFFDALLPVGLEKSLPDFSMIVQIFSHPALSLPMAAFIFKEGESFCAASTQSITAASATVIIIFIFAAFARYTTSFTVNKCVAGMHIAPILWSAVDKNQNS